VRGTCVKAMRWRPAGPTAPLWAGSKRAKAKPMSALIQWERVQPKSEDAILKLALRPVGVFPMERRGAEVVAELWAHRAHGRHSHEGAFVLAARTEQSAAARAASSPHPQLSCLLTPLSRLAPLPGRASTHVLIALRVADGPERPATGLLGVAWVPLPSLLGEEKGLSVPLCLPRSEAEEGGAAGEGDWECSWSVVVETAEVNDGKRTGKNGASVVPQIAELSVHPVYSDRFLQDQWLPWWLCESGRFPGASTTTAPRAAVKAPIARKPRPPSRVISPRKVGTLLSLDERMIRETVRKADAALPRRAASPPEQENDMPRPSALEGALEMRAARQARFPESLYIADDGAHWVDSIEIITEGPESAEEEGEEALREDVEETACANKGESDVGKLDSEDSGEYQVAFNDDLNELVDGYLGESGRQLEGKVLSSLGAGWVWLASAVAVMPRLAPGPHEGWKYEKHVKRYRGMAKIFREARKQQVGLDGEVCLRLIEAAGSVGFWERTVEVLEAMAVVGINRHPQHFRAVIRACMDAQQWNPALAVLRYMKSELGKLDPATEALAMFCREVDAMDPQDPVVFRDVWGDLDIEL